jgi:putative redox protein
MKTRIHWQGNVSFLAESGSGHQVLMDGAPEAGGQNKGPRPMEMILRKARQEVTDCVVNIEAQRAETDPKVFTHIHLHFILTGKNLNPQQVERAIHLSAEKYCSASIMLKPTVEITHDFEIAEATV